MDIIYKSLTELTPYSKNAKKHDDIQINNVAESIKQFGFVQPIVVDKDNVIVIGHCRALAAERLGMEEVPCVSVDDLTEEQVKKLRIADNKSNESPWDFDLLYEDIEGLDFDGFDFDFELYTEDEYGEEFVLPSGDKKTMSTLTFTLANEQAELIKTALQSVTGDIYENYGNPNKNGNALYEVVREWDKLRN